MGRQPALVGIEWRRVQLVLRLRGGVAPAPEPSALVLVSATGAVMRATRASADGDVVCARFNVIQGPGQMPLAPGRWTLGVAEGDLRQPLDLQTDAVPAAPIQPLRIPTVEGAYVVSPIVEGGRLHVDVRIEAAGPRRARRRRSPLPQAILLRVVDALLVVLRPLLARKPSRIVLVSELSTSLQGNLGAIRARLRKRGLDRTVDVIARAGPTEPWRLPDLARATWLFARAATIVTDGHVEVLQRVSRRVPTVQVWHGYGAFKQVGYSVPGTQGGISPFSRALKGYSAVTVGSDADVPVYAEAFGVPEERVHPTGIPRLDPFFDPSRQAEAIERARATFPQTVGRRVILLAPTYRGSVQEASYDLAQLDLGEIHRVCVEKDAVFLVRPHPFVRGPVDIPPALRDRIIDGRAAQLDVNDLLFIVDLLITDYSSVIYEFSTLDRPMLFFAFDLEAYEAERGFYEPYEAFVPGKIVRTSAELVAAIRADDFEADKVRPFASQRVGGTDGRSTDRVVDLILHGRVPPRPAADPFCR